MVLAVVIMAIMLVFPFIILDPLMQLFPYSIDFPLDSFDFPIMAKA
jgi:hypothetical protein